MSKRIGPFSIAQTKNFLKYFWNLYALLSTINTILPSH